jgi:hypothetical protein
VWRFCDQSPVTYLNPRADALPKISESNLKYSQILESDRRDWFGSDCVTDVPWGGSSNLIFGQIGFLDCAYGSALHCERDGVKSVGSR